MSTTMPPQRSAVTVRAVSMSADATATYPWTTLAVLALITAAMFVAELVLGTVRIPVMEALLALWPSATVDERYVTIVRTVRLPRALTAMTCGAALATSGLVLQTLFRNRLAGPWLLGVTGGARMGVALLILASSIFGYFIPARLGISGGVAVAISACLGAAATLGLMGLAARRVGSISLLILGLMLTFLLNGATSVLLHLVSEDQFRVWEAWNDGSFGGVTWTNLVVLLPVLLAGLVVASVLVRSLDALLLSERYAESMGVCVARVRQGALLAVALLAGVSTAYCGVIAFIDVAVPQLARGIMRDAAHARLIPATILLGAALALGADLLAHLGIGVRILHLNAILAVIGAPIVIWIVLQGTARREIAE